MVTIATQSLSSCRACEMAFVRIGDSLLEVLPELTLLATPSSTEEFHSAPKATVGLIAGVVRTKQDLKRLQALRSRVEILFAIGTCATAGGIPALCDAPSVDLPALLAQRPCTVPGPSPDPDHALLAHCLPAAHYVTVDLEVPGCPPHPDWLAECLLALVDARTPRLPLRCVCDHCPTRRSTTRSLTEELSRMLEQPEAPPRHSLDDMACLLEQGFMCMGPVTRAGCGGKGGPPRCIAAQVPCRGCNGPVNKKAQPWADVTAAFAAAGYDPATMPDKQGFLSRYQGFRMLNGYRRTAHE
ncbi:MAG: methyl viologen-reducing hydrogenase [Desulfovibrionaceae bacterium]